MRCDLFLLENKSATTTETTVTTVLQRTRTTLCSGILRGPSGGGVESAGAHKRGGRSWSQKGHLPTWGSHLAGAFVLLERSSQGACLAGLGRRRPYPPHHDRELDASPHRNHKGRPPVSGFGSPLAGPTSLKTARGGQVQDRSQ